MHGGILFLRRRIESVSNERWNEKREVGVYLPSEVF